MTGQHSLKIKITIFFLYLWIIQVMYDSYMYTEKWPNIHFYSTKKPIGHIFQ